MHKALKHVDVAFTTMMLNWFLFIFERHQFVFLSDTFFLQIQSVQMNDVSDRVPPFPELALTDMVCVSKIYIYIFFDRSETIFPSKRRMDLGSLSHSFGFSCA